MWWQLAIVLAQGGVALLLHRATRSLVASMDTSLKAHDALMRNRRVNLLVLLELRRLRREHRSFPARQEKVA